MKLWKVLSIVENVLVRILNVVSLPLIVCFTQCTLFFQKILFSIADLFAVRYLWVVCNQDKCSVVPQRAADIRVAWLVYVRTYACLLEL